MELADERGLRMEQAKRLRSGLYAWVKATSSTRQISETADDRLVTEFTGFLARTGRSSTKCSCCLRLKQIRIRVTCFIDYG